MTRRPVIGFAGLTHLGLVSAAATAAKGLTVVAFDPDEARVAAIAAGRLPVLEPGLARLLAEHGQRLCLTADATALGACDVVHVASDVPTDAAGHSDLGAITRLVETVAAVRAEDATLVVLSQVPPGFTRRLGVPPERLYHQVETLVFGHAVERATRPERFIVGCADPAAPLPAPYATLLEAFGCPVLVMRYESAELAKIAVNCVLAANVTATNTLAELSERVGADWSEIAPALRLDRRIGEHAYLTAGLGLAGGNVERDLATVARLSGAAGTEASLIAAFARNSAHRRDWVLRTLHAEALAGRPDAVVGVLGLAYKAGTDSTRNSPALALIRDLRVWQVRVYDPVVPARAATHPDLVAATSPLEAAQGADALAIMTPWPAFRDLKPSELGGVMRGRVVADPHGVLDGPGIAAAGLDHFTLGAPPRRARAR